MEITNERTGKKLEVIRCRSIWRKAKGLMFSRKRSLLFEFRKEAKVSLHMFFVFFPIDVFFVDSKKMVVEIKRNFAPFTFYNPKEKARFIIEVPSDRKTDMRIGDRLRFTTV